MKTILTGIGIALLLTGCTIANGKYYHLSSKDDWEDPNFSCRDIFLRGGYSKKITNEINIVASADDSTMLGSGRLLPTERGIFVGVFPPKGSSVQWLDHEVSVSFFGKEEKKYTVNNFDEGGTGKSYGFRSYTVIDVGAENSFGVQLPAFKVNGLTVQLKPMVFEKKTRVWLRCVQF